MRLIKPATVHKTADVPRVSMIIPVYNEAQVIVKKIKNIEMTRYPSDKLEAVFVDGGSDDGTADMIEKESKKIHTSVRVIRQGSRKGFNSAIIEGFPETTGDVICFPGAETEYHPDALQTLVTQLTNENVGAVTGKQKMENDLKGVALTLEVSYRYLYDYLRAAESRLDSPFDLRGEISACRRDICAKLVSNEAFAEKGCIDTCFAFQARTDGYRTVYEPAAVYYEHSPSVVKDLLKQRVRRAATLIQNMMIFKNMILNKRFGTFGMIIMPAHFLMLVVLPFFFLVGAVGLPLLAIIPSSRLIILILIAIMAVILLLSPGLQTFCINQVVLVVAVIRLVTGIETQKFERLPSTRN